jgi:hypothetical protein
VRAIITYIAVRFFTIPTNAMPGEGPENRAKKIVPPLNSRVRCYETRCLTGFNADKGIDHAEQADWSITR